MIWKDLFWFSRTERRGILIVCTLLIGIALFRYTLPLSSVDSPPDLAPFSEEYEEFISSIQKKETLDPPDSPYTGQRTAFNPNTADSLTLVTAGFSPFAAKNLLNYRRKGGVFHKPEDVKKIYGLTEESYLTLLPYIHLPKERPLPEKTFVAATPSTVLRPELPLFEKQEKYPEGTIIELNSADTTRLKMIPGIGTGLANRIISYRNRLGGYYQVEQLREIHLNTDTLGKWFRIEKDSIKKRSINKTGIETLRNHPYLNFYQAKVIVEHRRKRGKITAPDELKLYEEFTPQDLERIATYFSFD